MLWIAVLVVTALAPVDCLAQGTCCCRQKDGTECCGRAGNCESGVVPGCDCVETG